VRLGAPFRHYAEVFEGRGNSTQALTKGLHTKGMRVNSGGVRPIKLIRDPLTLTVALYVTVIMKQPI
jgi:hypothetical protein